jgi:hypothetical protein
LHLAARGVCLLTFQNPVANQVWDGACLLLFLFFLVLTELVVKRRCYRTNHPPLAARSCQPPSPLAWSHWIAPRRPSAQQCHGALPAVAPSPPFVAVERRPCWLAPPQRFITRMGCHRPRQPGCQPASISLTPPPATTKPPWIGFSSAHPHTRALVHLHTLTQRSSDSSISSHGSWRPGPLALAIS